MLQIQFIRYVSHDFNSTIHFTAYVTHVSSAGWLHALKEVRPNDALLSLTVDGESDRRVERGVEDRGVASV